MKKIYLASSFALKDKKLAKERKATIEEVAKILKEQGFDVYVPHQHKIPNAWDFSNKDWARMVFTNDLMAITDSDFVVMLSYGKDKNNGGVSWETGYAFGIGKKVIYVCMDLKEIESIMSFNGSYVRLNGINELKTYDLNNLPLIDNNFKIEQS